jgi:hypothetical protein
LHGVRTLLFFIVFAASLAAQRFPNTLATDADLYVGVNRGETTLSSGIDSATLTLPVASASGFLANTIITVENERMQICSVGGSSLTVCSRGFGGTSAASHTSAKAVRAQVTSEYHNASKDEIKAIESHLDRNLVVSSAYDFTALTPGGTLAAGLNTVTVAPVPRGVNGSDTGHTLWVSAGTGTAEACTISGGTAVSGGTSGTLILSCANTHSGAWTLTSGTKGIKEALVASAGSGQTVNIPTGLKLLNATVNVTEEGAKIVCASRNYVAAMLEKDTGVIFNVTAGSVDIGGCALRGGAYVSGGVGYKAPSGNIGIVAAGVRGCFHDLQFDQLYGGAQMTAGFHNVFRNIWSRNLTGYIIKHSGGVGPYIDTIDYATDLPFEVPIEGGIVINASGAFVYNTDILVAYNGIVIEPATDGDVTWTFIYDARFDQNFHAGVNIRNATAACVCGVFIHDLWSATAGVGLIDLGFKANGSSPGANDGIGLIIGEGLGPIKDVTVSGGQIFNNRFQNVKILAGDRITLTNLKLMEANTGSGVSGSIDNVYVAANGRVEISDSDIRGSAAGKPDMRSAVLLAPTTINAVIRNNTFTGTFTSGSPVNDLSNYPGSVVRNSGFNAGMDDVVMGLASAGTLSLPPRQYFQLSGTTTISTITPVYQGKKIYFYKADTGSIIFDTTGNIQSPTGTPGTVITLSQGQNAICEFTGETTNGRWLCRK